MTFNIRFLDELLEGSALGDAALVGEITLGDQLDGFQSLIGYWSPIDYMRQWRHGVERLVRDRRESCLITSLDDPEFRSVVFWWLLYPDGDIVHVREAMLLPEHQRESFSTTDPYSRIPPRVESPDMGFEVSEWEVPLEDFAAFLSRRQRR